jgi:hypothetical protein
MEDFFSDLYDDDATREGEPSFSLYEFKKWLSKQAKDEKAKKSTEAETPKDDLKEKFRERVKNRLKKRKKD